MPKVIYRGPSHRLEVDDLVLERDGEPVDLTPDQIQRASVPGEMMELETGNISAPAANSRGRATEPSETGGNS